MALEVDRGLVTMEGAKRYGVALNDDLSVDEVATGKLRDKMRGERAEIKLIDRGGEIEELRARCKEETGLEPPQKQCFASTSLMRSRNATPAPGVPAPRRSNRQQPPNRSGTKKGGARGRRHICCEILKGALFRCLAARPFALEGPDVFEAH